MDTEDDEQICRLCFSTQDNQINVFSDLGPNINVAEIINEHIGEVSYCDALPKTVCVECWSTTETFHKFHRFVKSSQADYLKRMVKCELAADFDVKETFTDQLSHVKPFIELGKDSHDSESFNEVIFPNVQSDILEDFQAATADQISLGNIAIEPEITLAEIGPNLAEDAMDLEENPLKGDAILLNRDDNEFDSDSNEDSRSESVDDRKALDASSNAMRKIIAQNFDCSCDVCHIDLKSLKNAIVHYRREHDNFDGYIKCCGYKFKRQHSVDDHVQWHIDPEMFKCNRCGKTMSSKNALTRHLGEHEKLASFECDLCGKVFAQKRQVARHLAKHLKMLSCKFCPQRCSTKELLERHESFYHNTGNTDDVQKQLDTLKDITVRNLSESEKEQIMSTHFDMTCDECDAVLESLKQAQNHYLLEHRMQNGFIKCCGIKFKNNYNIKTHMLWHKYPDMFTCTVCGRKENKIEPLRAHLALHMTGNVGKKNMCIECNKVFTSKNHLVRHMKDLHGAVYLSNKDALRTMLTENQTNSNSEQKEASVHDYFDMTCDVCNANLDSLQHAKMHYLDEHGNVDGYVKCCGGKFKEQKHINDHLRYHQNPDIFKCRTCNKTFMGMHQLKQHLYIHKNLESKRHTCEVCEKVFSKKSALIQHRLTHEKSKKQFQCEFCNRRFATEQIQKDHEQRIHLRSDEQKAEICEFCARTFSTRSEVLSHIRSQHSDNTKPREQVQCEICEAWLGNNYALKAHIQRHTAEPKKCPKCDKVSPNETALSLHIRNVHTERIHKCHLCDKSFKADYALKSHIAIHTGEKPFKCTHLIYLNY